MKDRKRVKRNFSFGVGIGLVIVILGLLSQREFISIPPSVLFFVWGPTLALSLVTHSPLVPYVSVLMYYSAITVLVGKTPSHWRIGVVFLLVVVHVISAVLFAKSLEFDFPLSPQMLKVLR